MDIGEKNLQFDFVKYIKILWANKYWIISIPIIVAVITAAISISEPRLYKATTSFVPEVSGDLSSVSIVNVQNKKSFYPMKASEYTRILISTLTSKRLLSQIDTKYNLKTKWKMKNSSQAIKKLRDNTSIKTLYGIVYLSVYLEDADLSYKIANDYMNFLKKVNIEMNSEKAKQSSKFLKDRLAETLKKKEKAEEDLITFQQKNKIVSIADQNKSLIASTSALYDKLVDTEVQLKQKLAVKQEKDPDVKELIAKRDELKHQLNTLQRKSKDDNSEYTRFAPALEEMPEIQRQYQNLFKEAELQRDIFDLLSKQLENIEIEASRDMFMTVQIIDEAEKPTMPSSRRTVLKSGSAFVIALALTIFAVFFKKFMSDVMKLVFSSKG